MIPRWSERGFTLIELMVALMITVVAVGGLLAALVIGFDLAETARNLTITTQAAQQTLEQIRATPVNTIPIAYGPAGNPGNRFALANPPGMGAVTVTQPQPGLLEVRIVVSWRQRLNRIIGEDRNLNGRLDPGEDRNGNGRLDSPCELITYVTQR